MWMSRMFFSFSKILLASLITGTVLAALNITVKDLVPQWSAQIDQLTDTVELVVNWIVIWAVPNILVGAVIIVPIWLILILFGPRK